MELAIRIVGLDEAKKKIENLSDFAGLMAIIAVLLHRQTTTRISSTKMSPDGVPWAPWSASYAKRRGQAGRGLLVKTGRLLGSITMSSTDEEARVSTPVFYAPFLQFGTSKMPARPFLGVGPQDEDEIVKAVQQFLAGKLGA